MEAKDVIALFSDKFGYVEDIEGAIEYLFHLNIEIDKANEILCKILQHNNNVEKNAKIYLNKQKQKFKNSKIDVQNNDNSSFSIQDEKNERIINVDSYLNQIRLCKDLDFITEVLPSIYDANYEEVIITILMALYNELCCANQMLKYSADKEEMAYLKNEIENCTSVINIIKSYNKEEIEEEENSDIIDYDDNVYKLIYLEKNDGTSYVYDDISDINDEDYNHTRNLIKSLINGKKFHEKRFSGYEEFKGLSAIRRGNSRIVFQRINNNTIIILGIFTKRCQNTIAYRDFIKRRSKLLQEQKDTLKYKTNDEGFMEYSDKITQNILKSLDKGIIKEKKMKNERNS